MNSVVADRAALADPRRAARIVVKVGSSSLTDSAGQLDTERLTALADLLAERIADGSQVTLVSSGAIASALTVLGLAERPRDLSLAQAAASVGQGLLMAHYSRAFAGHRRTVGQVLLTVEDVVRRSNYRNARSALNRLLDLGVVPIVNENDTVATHEVRFGDNDRLAALVAHLVHADALLLLTDVDGLYDSPPNQPGARRIDRVDHAADLDSLEITAPGSAVGTGGMVTKVEAALIATGAGVPVVLTSFENARAALAGQDVGTWFTPTGRRIQSRRLWLAHAARTRGRVVLDEGAVKAITTGKKSLLAAGVIDVEGDFEAGDPIELVGADGVAVARGLAGYSAEEIPERMGRTSTQLTEAFGAGSVRAMVHRDDLVQVRRASDRHP